MQWKSLNTSSDLNALIEDSKQTPQVIFKHSTRCSISSMSKSRLERSEAPQQAAFHYLDLISNRELSGAIAEKFGVHHESPQILVIKNGECTYDESHNAINMDDIAEQVA